MSEVIGEDKNTDDALGLYYIFSMMSEKNHNAYFSAILDDMEQVNGENISVDEKFIDTIIGILLDKFYETYKDI